MDNIIKYFRKFADGVIDYVKYLLTGIRLKQTITLVILLIGSLSLLFSLYTYWIDIAKIGIMAVVVTVGIGFMIIVDVVMLKDIDTYEAIKEKNMAYMLYMLCVSIIVSSCIIAFFG
jgi:hypothetical protein